MMILFWIIELPFELFSFLCFFNPLLPSMPYMARLAIILILILEEIIKNFGQIRNHHWNMSRFKNMKKSFL